jgi:hypothetical protein
LSIKQTSFSHTCVCETFSAIFRFQAKPELYSATLILDQELRTPHFAMFFFSSPSSRSSAIPPKACDIFFATVLGEMQSHKKSPL